MRAYTVAVSLAVLVVACTGELTPVALDAEEQPAPARTVRYLLHDTHGKARRALEAKWKFQVKTRREGGRELVETFGTHAHGLQLAAMGFQLLEVDAGSTTGFSDRGYHNPAQLRKAFEDLVRKHPREAKIVDLTKEYSMPKTIEGRSIYALKVSDNVHKDESEPNVLLVSNHHARELITPELALHFGRELLDGYKKAKEALGYELGEMMSSEERASITETKKIVEGNQVYIIPTMNPDGLNTVWTGNSWKRTNGRNVDLNRNYPIGWNLSCGGSTDSSGETWRGPKPFSEPETQTMRALQKDRNFAKVMDFHSYAEEVRTNYGNCAKLPPKVDKEFQRHRNSVAKKMQYQASRSCCMGGDIHYAYNKHGSLSFLTETGTAFQPPSAEKDRVLKRVWPGVKDFLKQPISTSGVITDKKSGKPVTAKLSLPQYDWKLNEQKQSGKRGHYHLWLPAGKHKMVVKARGKPTKRVTVTAKKAGHVQHIKV